MVNITQGVTVYRAIKHSGTKIGDWIVVPGAGGGLGHLGMDDNPFLFVNTHSSPPAIQYANQMGLRVVAIGKPQNTYTISNSNFFYR